MKSPAQLALASLALLLAACGGGGSGDEPVRPETRVIQGVVEDGPIADAQVVLRHARTGEILQVCGSKGDQPCVAPSKTGRQGIFSIPVPPGLDLTGLEIAAIFGEESLDQGTGLVFRGLEMSAPLDLFAGSATVISPLTTLVGRRAASGAPLAQAVEETGRWLGLPAAWDPTARPSQNPDILRRALLLSRVVVEMPSHPDPFSLLSAATSAPPLVAGDRIEADVLAPFIPDAGERTRLADLYAQIAGSPVPEAVFRREELAFRLKTTIREAFSYQGELDEAVVRRLADQVLTATAGTVVPLDIYRVNTLCKYLMQFYPLNSIDLFLPGTVNFPPALVNVETGRLLEEDGKLRELIQLRYLYDVEAKLEDDELVQTEAERLRYYFNSNASRLNRAARLTGAVLDDRSIGAIRLDIMKNKARYGFVGVSRDGRFENVPFRELPDADLFPHFRAELETQMFDTEYRGRAFREVGEGLLSFGYRGEVVQALREAERLYRGIIDNKLLAPAVNLQESDFRNLHSLAASYRHAGDYAATQSLLDYMDGLTTYLNTVVAIGRVFVGQKNLANELIDGGQSEDARPVAEDMYTLATRTPPNEVSYAGKVYRHYLARVSYLRDTAVVFAALGDWEAVISRYNEVQGLRSSDGLQNLTAAETWVVMPSFVELLYRAGRPEEALGLAASIPDTFVNYQGVVKSGADNRKKGLTLVVTYEALGGSLDRALQMVTEHFTVPADQVQALTYFAQNPKAPYMALALINAGRLEEAGRALDMAAGIVDGMNPATDKERYDQIKLGYLKIADLHRQRSDAGRASSLLAQAENVARGMAASRNRVDALVGTAVVFGNLNRPADAGRLLQEALGVANSLRGTGLIPEEMAATFEIVAQGATRCGDRQADSPAIQGMVEWSLQIPDDFSTRTGKKVDFLLKASRLRVLGDERAEAIEILALARTAADSMVVPSSRYGKFINDLEIVDPITNFDHLIGGYLFAGDSGEALRLAEGLPGSLRDQALVWLANGLSRQDDLPLLAGADVDTDGDGLPDFFHPLATFEERGLGIDPDSDGDGIPDGFDRRPLFPSTGDRSVR